MCQSAHMLAIGAIAIPPYSAPARFAASASWKPTDEKPALERVARRPAPPPLRLDIPRLPERPPKVPRVLDPRQPRIPEPPQTPPKPIAR